MAHKTKSDEKIVYVGDSRVIARDTKQVPPDYSAYPGKSEVFIPNFLLKEWMVAVVALVGVLVLVMSEPAPLGNPADPLNGSFIPMPDWYFLFLYQLLKYPYTSGHFVVIGGLGLPGLLFVGLVLAPFLDRGKERRFYRRPVASTLMFTSLAAIVYLTTFSWHHYQHELKITGTIPEHIKNAEERKEAIKRGEEPPKKTYESEQAAVVAPEDPGALIYAKATCVSCHGTDLEGAVGPALTGVGDRHDKASILAIMHDGINSMPKGQYEASKDKGISDAELDQLANWLAMQKTGDQSEKGAAGQGGAETTPAASQSP